MEAEGSHLPLRSQPWAQAQRKDLLHIQLYKGGTCGVLWEIFDLKREKEGLFPPDFRPNYSKKGLSIHALHKEPELCNKTMWRESQPHFVISHETVTAKVQLKAIKLGLIQCTCYEPLSLARRSLSSVFRGKACPTFSDSGLTCTAYSCYKDMILCVLRIALTATV